MVVYINFLKNKFVKKLHTLGASVRLQFVLLGGTIENDTVKRHVDSAFDFAHV